MAETDPLSLIGKTLAGHFLVESLTGEGRFSIVYRGQHIGPKESVALKCLKLGLELDGAGAETFLKRFREENKTNSRVSKGNALFVRSIGSGMTTSDAGQHVPYTVLEWLDGRSLAAELATRRAQGGTGRPMSDVLALLGPAITALGHAHDSDVAHGDVSPGTFFLAGADVKVLDLGVAKLVSDLCREIDPSVTHARIFSPQYGAPEHFDSRLGDFGPWTDVYGIALVILELLRDRPAVEILGTGSTREQAPAVLDPLKRPTPRALGLRVGDAVERVMSRAVALVARERYASAGDFLDALKAAMQKDVAGPVERAPNGKIDEYSPADDEFDTLVRPPGESDKSATSEPRPAAGGGGAAGLVAAPSAPPIVKAVPKPQTMPIPAPMAMGMSATPAAVLPHAPPSAPAMKSIPAAPKPGPAPIVPASHRATAKMVMPARATPSVKPDHLPAAPGSNPSLAASPPIHTPHLPPHPPPHAPPPPPPAPAASVQMAPPPPVTPPPVHVAPPPPPPAPPPPAPSAAPASPPTTGIGDTAKNVRDVIPPAPTNIPVGDLPSVIVDDAPDDRTSEQRRQDQMLRARETVRLDIRPGTAPAWVPQPPTPPGSNPGLPVAAPSASSPGPGALPIVALQDRTDPDGRRPAMSYEARRARSRSRLIIVAFVSFLVVFLAGATILGVHWFLAAREEAAPAPPTTTSP